ncbi:TPA: VOC family protein [Serratia marcescens]
MFDHVKFGVSNFAFGKAFFLNVLAPLGVKIVAEGAPGYGVELCPDRGNVSLCLFQTDEKPAHLHLAFAASSRAQVDAFYHAALNAGGIDNGAPGLWPNYHAHYYAAFVIAPDGHNIEAVCHNPMS